MKIAVIGTSGQLGFDLARILPTRGHEVIPLSGRAELDIDDHVAFIRMLDSKKPDAVINTAAFHNVDLCEKEEAAAYRTNNIAVAAMALACESRRIIFMQIGTDYVFGDGNYSSPIPESTPPTPNSVYSMTRSGGDFVTLTNARTLGYVVRSCGLFGIAGCKLKGGLNFVDTMIKLAREGKPLRVVNDQVVAPTPTDDLAAQLAIILEKRPPVGLYHAVSHGECSWYEFAKTALELAKIPHAITPVSSAEFAAPAKRPAYSVLDNAKLRAAGLDIMKPWRESLERYIRAKYPPK